MRVLLVEDDAVLASVMLDALTDSGHSARHVNNPDEAFRLANAERWDAIVVDGFGDSYMQPDAEYRTAVRQLGRRSPVVVTSARAWAGSASAADLGVAAILSKPFDIDQLIGTLGAVAG